MKASADTFGIAFDESAARAALDTAVGQHRCEGRRGALRVRLTLGEAGRFACTAAALPPTREPWTYQISPYRVYSRDPLLRHKTDWRELYESEAARSGADETLFLNESGELAEGARTNIFVQRGDILLTPPLESGALDGRLRAELLVQGRAAEAVLTPADLKTGEVFLGNSLRGLVHAVPAGAFSGEM